jgi:secreted PhoX family phosphatase
MTEREDDFVTNTSGNTPFSEILGVTLKRRSVLRGGALGAAAFFTGGTAFSATAEAQTLLGSWESIPTSYADKVVVPDGYTAQPFIPWGTPIVPSGPEFKQDASNTGAEQEQQLGMGHDGIRYFPLRNRVRGTSASGLLALNHEYTVDKQLFTDGTANWTKDKTRKSQAAHGVTIVEVHKGFNGKWNTAESSFARRIHVNTPTQLTGPAAGHRLLQTEQDKSGMYPVGILNQCGNGYTPWGTYLTTEENFNGYFYEQTGGSAPGIDEEQAAINARYGVGGTGFGYLWATTDDRFRADKTPREPNRFGWIVEIDPYAPDSKPLKRSALGRFKHEGAAFATGAGGQAVVYMGDDQRFDYIYKFVSNGAWATERSAGRSPLDDGTLYVARFDANGTGTWLPLVQGTGPLTAENGFADQGDVLIKARMAADALGATPMDRAEWTTVHPTTGEVFCTLTNNTRRTEANAANPRASNPWGHIIKWKEPEPAATTFSWDIFLFAGPGDGAAGSDIDAEDQFGSPDGLWIDDNGRMWIQTDGRQPDGSNNQMLMADPATREIKRFLVGPVDCEVTGVTMTPDSRTMFINIQHPGDGGFGPDAGPDNPTQTSSWPDGENAGRPRPATVVIQRKDGKVVGT